MQARQQLVRERRENAERIRRSELEKKIQEKQMKLKAEASHEERRKKEITEKWKAEVELKQMQLEVEEMVESHRMHQQRSRAGSVRKSAKQVTEPVVDAKLTIPKRTRRNSAIKNNTLAPSTSQYPHLIDSETQKHHRQEREAKLARGLLKSEELYSLHLLKSLRSHFSAWRDIVLTQRLQCNNMRNIIDWKLKNRLFGIWRAQKRKREGLRFAEEQSREMRKQHEKWMKAERYHSKTLLSKTFIGWVAWVKMEREYYILVIVYQLVVI
jgi:hypothetical protein